MTSRAEGPLKSSPNPSLPYETARHSDVQQTFARVEWQRLEEKRSGQCVSVLRGSAALLFREQALAATSPPPAPANTAQPGVAQSRRKPFHHG